jgi:hypothetical protein
MTFIEEGFFALDIQARHGNFVSARLTETEPDGAA